MRAYDAASFEPLAPLALVTVKSEQWRIVMHDVPELSSVEAGGCSLRLIGFRSALSKKVAKALT
jgi:hypothetical protein